MPRTTNGDDRYLKLLEEADELQRIGNRAVRKAQEEGRRRGVPLVFTRNGRIYYELPDGTITQESPFKNGDADNSGDGDAANK